MKRITSSLYFALLAVGLVAFAAPAKADHWANRPAVIRAADKLAEEMEHFDEAMHAAHAPEHFIGKVHHFEETVMEFATEVRTCTYQQAYQEMNHIRQDVGLIREEFNAHPQLLQNFQVYTEWKHVRTAYRYLDHAMYQWDTNRWNSAKVEALKNDVAEMEAAHE